LRGIDFLQQRGGKRDSSFVEAWKRETIHSLS